MVATPAHLGGHFGVTHCDEPTLNYLMANYAPIVSMIDVGCGPGAMVDLAVSKGIRAIGIDGDPAVVQANGGIVEHDYTTGSLSLWPVDLVWSVEFVEHVEERFVWNFLETFRNGRVLMMTHALPGQGGHHHVNEQLPEYWHKLLRSDGWTFDEVGTNWIRANATDWYVRDTGMIWHRP